MDQKSVPVPKLQSVTMEKFLYHFLGLRKGEIRRRVKLMKERHPGESPEHLARRMVAGHMPLSLVGAAILHVPMFVPGIGPVLKGLGVAGGAATLMRLHTALIMEIAVMFGRNLDERARLKEIWTVMSLAGLASASPLLIQRFGMKPLVGISAGMSSVSAVSEIIGEIAIQYYKRTSGGTPAEDNSAPAPLKTTAAAPMVAPVVASSVAPAPAPKAPQKPAPRAASKATSEPAPKAAAKASSESAPKAAGKASSESAPKAASKATSEAIPKAKPKANSEAAPEVASAATSEPVPEVAPKTTH